jgi:hypothetical protein
MESAHEQDKSTEKYKSSAELTLTLRVDRDVVCNGVGFAIELGDIMGFGKISLSEQFEHIKDITLNSPIDEATINFTETDIGTFMLDTNADDTQEFETYEELVDELTERIRTLLTARLQIMMEGFNDI